jgi:hypothetical protein
MPLGHAQPPPVQVWPPVHATPQPPQFAGSSASDTHAPLQSVSAPQGFAAPPIPAPDPD